MNRRIVIYGMNYAPEIAGVGRYTGEIGEHFAKLGYETRVITTPPHYPGWIPRPSHSPRRWTREVVAGVAVYRCPLWLHPDMKGLRRLLAPLSFALSSAPIAFWQILRRRPDVVIAVEPTLLVAPIALLAARLAGARTVLHVQDLEVDAAFAVGHLRTRSLQRIALAFERLVMTGFDRVITISGRMAERLADKGVRPERIEIVRNWVDVEAISPMASAGAYRTELGLRNEDFVVLYAGTIGAKHGLGLLIEAARRLAARPDIVFVIAGEGPMRSEIEQAAKILPNLRVMDFQPQERFGDFLALADVHVLPQERAAADLVLPSKLGGMLASGRPVIVTADPGTELAEFVGTSCVLTPPGDAAALAEAIVRLSSEPASAGQASERLARARQLSLCVGIQDFTTAALSPEPPTAAASAPQAPVAAPTSVCR
ncbi:MAG: WcaI family glycosyltransferase [Caulobacteraceae bacterium]|nr:WcaI family glycosyltransferase [Caulobacteraceae bacterium]